MRFISKFFKRSEPDRVSVNEKGQKLLICPLAEQARPEHDMNKCTKGKYEKGYPEGMVVHFTSGSSAESSLSWGKGKNFAFWMIKRDGTIIQTHSLDRWGSHAGTSFWPGLGSSLSSKLLGVEMDNASKLEERAGKLFSWFGREIKKENARYSKGEANIQPGWYEKFTPQQEQSLKELALWLKRNNPEVFNLDYVIGHDEASPGRKSDPGAALSMTMPEFRELLKKEYT